MLVGLIITFIVTVPIALLWARGIDRMPKDYKGHDFLNWNEDEDKNHTEGEI